MPKIIPMVCVGFEVWASVVEEGPAGEPKKVLRSVSSRFVIESAALEFLRMAKATYPDAYLRRIEKPERGRRAGQIK